MNILITSAGRRGYMVDYFKKAVGTDGEIHAGNSSPVASALHHADKSVITPLIYNPGYIPFLVDYCKKENISAIISLFDVDLKVLAKNRDIFNKNGIEVIVSDESVIDICNDKLETYKFLSDNGFSTPKTFSALDKAISALKEGELLYPVIIKPRWGMGSIAVYEAESELELRILYDKCVRAIRNSYLKYESEIDLKHSVLIQSRIKGQEFGMDVINDLSGSFKGYVVRKKIEMRAGETDSAMVIEDERFGDIARKLSKTLGHIGNLDVDLFESDDLLYVLEMNARFGGGYPFSHAAGVDLAAAIVKWLCGEDVKNELEVDRYDELLCKEISVVEV